MKKISIIADANFTTDVFAVDPISDKRFLFSWVFKIIEKRYGEYSQANLLSFLGCPIKIKRETENGYFVIVKGEEFYLPKHQNVSVLS